ncbi:MAG TPA: 4a-hydroxytetrahydrobiopterin dehydratase [Thermoleophilaceae bacterium]|jgi:4a-hydroxytetrahydrobiopterin dehydratase|nr:4a-hydroxytetrahydrobiopterin dehydratase [Thermoleophilaceae bacterium]
MSVLSDEDVQARLSELGDGWEKYGNSLRREFKFDDFSGAVDFVNRLTPIANELNHHPDVFLSWGLARVSLISHSEHGITEKDFELAKKLDDLA